MLLTNIKHAMAAGQDFWRNSSIFRQSVKEISLQLRNLSLKLSQSSTGASCWRFVQAKKISRDIWKVTWESYCLSFKRNPQLQGEIKTGISGAADGMYALKEHRINGFQIQRWILRKYKNLCCLSLIQRLWNWILSNGRGVWGRGLRLSNIMVWWHVNCG